MQVTTIEKMNKKFTLNTEENEFYVSKCIFSNKQVL